MSFRVKGDEHYTTQPYRRRSTITESIWAAVYDLRDLIRELRGDVRRSL